MAKGKSSWQQLCVVNNGHSKPCSFTATMQLLYTIHAGRSTEPQVNAAVEGASLLCPGACQWPCRCSVPLPSILVCFAGPVSSTNTRYHVGGHTVALPGGTPSRLVLRELEVAVEHYLGLGLAQSMHKTYSLAQQYYLQLCQQTGLQPIPPSEH